MARRRRFRTVPDARTDLISQLPEELKQRILECLPTRYAARTALLSNHWNDVWLRHGRLVFDSDFFECIQNRKEDDGGMFFVNVINNIVFSRAGPIKKFTLEIGFDDPKPLQYDINQWCLFLSKIGVEELKLSFFVDPPEYKLPFCIVSCRTIKLLKLKCLLIDLPVNVNGGCIFPSVTSLDFELVEFERSSVNRIASRIGIPNLEIEFERSSVNRIASRISIPNLEKVTFFYCEEMNKFEVSSPKLETLSVVGPVDPRWLAPHLKVIKNLWLCGSSLAGMDVSVLPTSRNIRVMKLDGIGFGSGKEVTTAMQLLQKLPNLCELDIVAEHGIPIRDEDNGATSRLLEDPDNCFISQDLKMLNTVKIKAFSGSALEMLLVKMLLAKSPALERVFIQESKYIDPSKVVNILWDLLRFPRASLKAQIVRIDYGLVDYLA